MIRFIDLDAQKKIVPELDSALRRGAGFATRAAVADAVTSLCSTCPNAFKFPGLSTSNPSVRLLRALYFASERERGASSKDKMTHALGSLAELAPGKAVRTLATRVSCVIHIALKVISLFLNKLFRHASVILNRQGATMIHL
jgi:proteasome component ECM29